MSRVLAWAWMPGHPRTKGSLNPHAGGGLSDSAASKRWRAQMVDTVSAARSMALRLEKPSTGAIAIEALCFMPERSAQAVETPNPEESSGVDVAPAAIAENTSNGDVDKLARNLLDALAVDLVTNDPKKGADVFRNDVQVTDLFVRKLVELPNYGQGILVRVVELDAAAIAAARHLAHNMLWCAEHGFLPDNQLIHWTAALEVKTEGS